MCEVSYIWEGDLHMNHVEFSKEILILVGGEKNVSNFTHCITRLRFNVKDKKVLLKQKISIK